jgi:hypothetical protein
MEFKEGDMVSVFEGTHNRGNRTSKFIGRVVGFDAEKNLWKVGTVTLTLNLCGDLPNPFLDPDPTNPILVGSKCDDGEEGATIYSGRSLHASYSDI